MTLGNLEISRVIVHEVIRSPQAAERPAVLSDALVILDRSGKELVARRLISTVASGSHCVDVTVEDSGLGSPFDHLTRMLDAKDSDYIASSRHLADSLSKAQTAGSIKSGSAIFVQGTCDADDMKTRFVAVIKADSDQGLYKDFKGDRITLTYVGEMLLGESQRLIKIAFFFEDADARPKESRGKSTSRKPEDFTIKVFDHLMQNAGDGNAAAYFYSTFLKCGLALTASRQTKDFHDLSMEFVDSLNLNSKERFDLRGDLISCFRGNTATIVPREFARTVFPTAASQDAFLHKCRERDLDEAFSKDNTLIKGRLRRQSVKFSSEVTIYAKPEILRDNVKIGQTSNGWTKLEIKGTIEDAA